LKEKEAVDASIKVLTSTQQGSPRPSVKTNKKRAENTAPDSSSYDQKSKENMLVSSPLTEDKQENSEDNLVSVDDCDHPLRKKLDEEYKEEKKEDEKEKGDDENDDDENDDDDDNESNSLRDKVATLTLTLQTVMEQKGIMESNYQVDKKKMMVGGTESDTILYTVLFESIHCMSLFCFVVLTARV
jgi:hypothetical protein